MTELLATEVMDTRLPGKASKLQVRRGRTKTDTGG